VRVSTNFVVFDLSRLTRVGWILFFTWLAVFVLLCLCAAAQLPKPIVVAALCAFLLVTAGTGILDAMGDSVHMPEARLRHLAQVAAAAAAAAAKDPGADSPP
jgi:hypothetical protein